MEKVVVSSQEVESVRGPVPPPLSAPKLPRAMGLGWQILLAPLVLVLPLLSLLTIGVWVATRGKEPRVRQAWLNYCCGLLVVSGILSSMGAGVVFLNRPPQAEVAAAPFALNGPVALPGGISGKTLTPRELASRVENAVFIVARESKWGKPTRAGLEMGGFGTGVLLYAGEDEYLIATSRHVLDGENWEHATPYKGEAVLWDRGGGFSRAEIIGRHKELDLMLLRMPREGSKEQFAQRVVDFDKIAPGERIMIFGHPEGLFFSLADGLVSRKEASGQIQITAPVSPGASGGPVYNMNGELLGIVTSMLDKRTNPSSENLNFAIRADEFLRPDQWTMEPAGKAALEKYVTARSTPAAAQTISSVPTP